jgi:murein DD-endopeptidase MepM/ murein hydrolase activator NlpD
MVAAATAGAGLTSYALGTTLPREPDTITLAASASNVTSSAAEPSEAATEREPAREAATQGRSSRSQRRAGAPVPAQIPQWARPARGEITTYFEMRWGEFHPGLDIAAPLGTPVRAASEGVVTMAGWNGGFGKMVLIDHGGGVTTLYGHNADLRVEVGERVVAGQLIADMGSTGYSTGSHVHFEVHVGEDKVDPRAWLRKRGVSI